MHPENRKQPAGLLLPPSIFHNPRWAVLVFAFVTAGVSCLAQNLSSETVINFNPAEFNLQALHPSFPIASPVFAGGRQNPLPVTIRQWTDGSITLASVSRTQTTAQQSGYSQTVQSGGSINFGGVGGTVSQAYTSTRSLNANATNALSIVLHYNTLIALVQFTVQGVVYLREITLGTISPVGGLVKFPSGFLAGNAVIFYDNPATTVTGEAPAKETVWVGDKRYTYKGVVKSGGARYMWMCSSATGF